MPDDLFHCGQRFFWLPFESGWFQRRSSSYSASIKSFETPRRTWFFSFWDGILSINSYHMRYEYEKTFTGIHISASSLLLWNDFSLYRIDLRLCRIDLRCISKSTSICVETTLYGNKRTCEICPRLHCTYDAMHLGIDTTWRTDDAKECYSFIYNCSAFKEITLLLEN